METAALVEALEAEVRQQLRGARSVEGLARLGGGASKETWGFDAVTDDGRLPLVLRRAPGGREGEATGDVALPLASEAALIGALHGTGVPVPRVHFACDARSALGDAFVMDRLRGTADPLRVIHDPALASAREGLAFEVGALCARLQSVEITRLPDLRPPVTLDALRQSYRQAVGPNPVFELALRWLADNAPPPVDDVLVHGDFRNSNLLVAESGLMGLIDWELSRLGDPMHDLAFLCVPSWRFGATDKPVGGFGELEDLFAGYASVAGREVDRGRFHYRLVWNVLWWGIGTALQAGAYRGGTDRSIERATIGRRMGETELDLLDLLEAS